MKQVKFAKKWRNAVNDTTVHEYPAGWSGPVSNEVAERAQSADVLDGAPREVSPARRIASAKPSSKSAAKPKAAKPADPAPVTPAADPAAPAT
ncbi:hypothetical protein [Brevundimonas sp.]